METDEKLVKLSEFTISYFMNSGEPITQLKLNKLLYYMQAWYLVHFDKAKLFEEQPEAWVNGPVYPTIYRSFAQKKDSPLRIKSIFLTTEELFQNRKKALNLSSREEQFINAILQKYGALNDLKLVYTTHTEKPWLEARGNLPPFARSTAKISFETMYSYYSARLQN